jgi:hypothetical protein
MTRVRRKPRIVQAIQKRRRYFSAASKLLELVYQAREGGKLSAVLGGIAATGEMVDIFYPKEGSREVLANMGLNYNPEYALGGLYVETLMKMQTPEVVAATPYSQTFVWFDEDGVPVAGALYYSGNFGDGPYIAPGGEERFKSMVQKSIWKHHELSVAVLRSGDHSYRGNGRFTFDKMAPLGRYLRARGPEWYVDRLRKFPEGAMTLLLRGPTGVGKSVLARHISRGMRPDASRTLKFSSKVLSRCSSNELVDMVKVLQPTVLLLDDLDLKCRDNTETLLDILEALRDPNCMVIVTMMTPADHVEEEVPKRGSWHFEGMRPGRIDQVFTLYPPDEADREAILRDYLEVHLGDEDIASVVEKTDGLTGAYLREVSNRLNALGTDNWEEEVNAVLYTSPAPPREDDDECGDGDEGERSDSPKGIAPTPS